MKNKKHHDIIDVAVVIEHQTEKAILVENLNDQKVWIPKSQIQIDGDTIQIPEWLAKEKGLL